MDYIGCCKTGVFIPIHTRVQLKVQKQYETIAIASNEPLALSIAMDVNDLPCHLERLFNSENEQELLNLSVLFFSSKSIQMHPIVHF